MLDFEIRGQKIDLRSHAMLASGQADFVRLRFTFSNDWDELDKTAQFTQHSKTYNVHLGTGTPLSCLLPSEIQSGALEFSVFGYASGGTVVATTAPLLLHVKRSGFVGNGETPIPPTPDLYAQLLEELEKRIAGIQDGKDGASGLSAYEIAVANGFEGTEEEWLASLKGEKGDTGETGADGQNGQDGKDGVSPTITAAETDSGYDITITDAEHTETISLRNGTDGENGADGQDGKDGIDGSDGLSAYEIAVANGFSGTQSEWLESLRGADGETPDISEWETMIEALAAAFEDTGWVDATINESYISSGAVQYRIIGNRIFVRGESLVLAQDLPTVNPNPVPLALATLGSASDIPLDGSYYGVGYSPISYGSGMISMLCQYGSAILVDAHAISEEISAGTRIGFSISGFIEKDVGTSSLTGTSGTISTGTFTLAAADWENDCITVTLDGVTEKSCIDLALSYDITADQLEAFLLATILPIEQGDGYFILKAWGGAPTVDVPMRYENRGDSV